LVFDRLKYLLKVMSPSFFVPRALLLTWVLVWVVGHSQAQYGRNKARGLSRLTAGLGPSYFIGDLEGKTPSKKYWVGYHVGLGVTYQLFERVAVRGDVRFYEIKGGKWADNLWFVANNWDVVVGGEISLFAQSDKRTFNPYFLLGIGLTTNNPTTQLAGTWYNLREYQTEAAGYGPLAVVVPLGLGLRWQLDDQWDVGVELNHNYAFSDYLDDVSNVYAAIDSGAEPIRAILADRRPEIGGPPNPPGGIRGNPSMKDGYFFLDLKVGYVIGTGRKARMRKQLKCN
jgi:hypothetical protein